MESVPLIPLVLLATAYILSPLVVAYRALLAGKIYTANVVIAKDAEIAHNRETIKEVLEQNGRLIEERRATLAAFDALRTAYDALRASSEGLGK